MTEVAYFSDRFKILEGYDERTRIFYLATAPKLFGAIARGLSQNGLINEEVRIVLELAQFVETR